MGFYHLRKILLTNIENNFGRRTRFFKNCFQIVHKAGDFLGNNIADAVTKADNDKIVKPVEKIIIPPEKREETLNKLSIIKMEQYKISKLINDSTASKFVTKNASK